MDPILVDVNVHPSKLEVRISKEQELNKFVTETIKTVFKTKALIPSGLIREKVAKEKSEQTILDFDPLQLNSYVQEDNNRSKRFEGENVISEPSSSNEFNHSRSFGRNEEWSEVKREDFDPFNGEPASSPSWEANVNSDQLDQKTVLEYTSDPLLDSSNQKGR